MEFHSHLVGRIIAAFAKLISFIGLLDSSGHSPFSHGYMNAIPAIAAYDS
jgi:hypothetical protein